MIITGLRMTAAALGVWMGVLPAAGAGALSAADRQFLTAAANMDNSQAALGRLALQRASDPSVRRYAQRILADHARIEARLEAVASVMGVPRPTHLDAPIRGELAHLARFSGPGFDRELIRWELLDFRYHVQQFRGEATTGHNREVKRFAQEFLPVIEAEYRTARRLAGRSSRLLAWPSVALLASSQSPR